MVCNQLTQVERGCACTEDADFVLLEFHNLDHFLGVRRPSHNARFIIILITLIKLIYFIKSLTLVQFTL